MKIDLDKKHSIHFEILVDYETKKNTDEWLGKIIVDNENNVNVIQFTKSNFI